MLRIPGTVPAIRFVASDWNATKRPSGVVVGRKEPWSAVTLAGPGPRLTSSVVPASASRTTTLANASLSKGDRLSAFDQKATRALSETTGAEELEFAPAPPGPSARLTSAVVDWSRSRRKALVKLLSSSADRLFDADRNVM